MPIARPDRQRGLTLIELMIAILLGAILSLGIVNLYLESKRNYGAEEEMARMQENGRYVLDMLKRELMLAGFFGGTLDADDMVVQAVGADCAGANWALDATNTLEFVDDHNVASNPVTNVGTTLTCVTGSDVQPLSDVLAIKRTAGEPTLRNGSYADNFDAMDTHQRWYMRVSNLGEDRDWAYLASDSLDASLEYWEAYARVFYIRKYSESAADKIPTLCEQYLEGNAMTSRCLAEGIEELQIEFGIDSDADGVVNQYKSAPTSADMANAVAARVYLLVRSIDTIPGYTNAKSYQLGQRAVAAKNDGFLRRVFSTTVQIRNATMPVS